MVKFSAKILTSVISVSKYKPKKVPKIAVTPIMSGIAEATSAPKTKTSKIKVIGIEIASESFKSS